MWLLIREGPNQSKASGFKITQQYLKHTLINLWEAQGNQDGWLGGLVGGRHG